MRKAYLIILLTLYINICAAQEFDRLLEKDIKTEINFNRMAKRQNRLQLSSFHKTHADSINRIVYRSYKANTVEDSRGVREDWEKIWPSVDAEFKKYYAHFNVLIIKDGDYKGELKKEMLSSLAYYYNRDNYEISLSAIRDGDKIFLTVMTW